jgi:hypothetical protein
MYVHTRLGSFLPPAPTPSLTTHSQLAFILKWAGRWETPFYATGEKLMLMGAKWLGQVLTGTVTLCLQIACSLLLPVLTIPLWWQIRRCVNSSDPITICVDTTGCQPHGSLKMGWKLWFPPVMFDSIQVKLNIRDFRSLCSVNFPRALELQKHRILPHFSMRWSWYRGTVWGWGFFKAVDSLSSLSWMQTEGGHWRQTAPPFLSFCWGRKFKLKE